MVLIVVDTLRADYVNSDAPSFAAATPHIRAIAHTGQTFTTTLTPGANTSIALPAMFTSRNATDLDFRVPTLAERFADAGWETAAVTSDFFVTREDPNVRRTLDGFTRVHVYDRAKQSELVPMVRRTLDEVGDQPFFAWVHVDAPHFPGWCGQPGSGRHFAWPLEYVRGVEWADAQVGLIAEELTRRRLDNDVVLIVVGDHGEGLRDLRTPWHGLMAAPAIAEVPFIVRIPGVPGRSRPETVGSIDLAPTIAALAALRPSPYDLGQDLTGPTRSRGYLTSALDQGAQLAYTDGATRIIYDFDLELAVDLSRKGDAGSMNGLAALELAVPQTFLDHGVRTKDIRNAQRAVLNLPHRHSALSTELARPVLRTLSHRERTRAYRDWLAASPSWDATTAILAEWALVDAKTSTHECTRLFQGASEREQSAFAVALTHRGLGCLAPSALTKFLRDCLDAPDAPLACSAGIGLARHIETAPEVLLTAIEQLSTLDATTPHHGAMLAQALEAASITRSTGALASAMRDRALHLIRDRRTGVRAGAF
ncbi:MAG: sulfatase-like hydrolase/transferase, partial [Myxococcales bacterium]|nr:sulfatase-like hydrolase/transferase [Myxococcales bacterium]